MPKTLASEQDEIERLWLTDRYLYNLPEKQARLQEIIAERQARGELDAWGNEQYGRALTAYRVEQADK